MWLPRQCFQVTNAANSISLHHCTAHGREVLGSTGTCVMTGRSGPIWGQCMWPAMDTPGPRHEEGLGERRRAEGLTNGNFYLSSRGRCTLAPGKGGKLGEGVGREWYLQVQKVTTSEKRKKVANCHARPVLPGAKAKCLQTAFPAFSRWEAQVCILPLCSKDTRAQKFQQQYRKSVTKLEAGVL